MEFCIIVKIDKNSCFKSYNIDFYYLYIFYYCVQMCDKERDFFPCYIYMYETCYTSDKIYT